MIAHLIWSFLPVRNRWSLRKELPLLLSRRRWKSLRKSNDGEMRDRDAQGRRAHAVTQLIQRRLTDLLLLVPTAYGLRLTFCLTFTDRTRYTP